MHPAVRIHDIEEHVRKNLYPYPKSSILLIFSSYSGKEDGDNYDFLRSLHSYHYHSGQNTACYCIGYSVTDPTQGVGPGKKVPEEFGVKFFIPNYSKNAELLYKIHLIKSGNTVAVSICYYLLRIKLVLNLLLGIALLLHNQRYSFLTYSQMLRI